ncbi:Coenzyme F420 hydrogenase/dehydrogenase, beta subunit C-terminal domain [Vibrio crassostreae]|uniref:Coenzyme F420 hydrogenase/dehydrogenase, beta subunit C-terminal domain n=1 Tax=Vibrio crassostreae TaxID=246167 RepID=UPI00104CE96F|nr:Coenzyme F420 hydrogenase/dehydrogenase, beta subunit C-terminal domain [Vibrio crassostreae]TCN93848.1 coenzyme F420-reducing hydrogenase beta subunit [Vibrio crassostreae]CAK2010511.1 Coenzyme F420-reducing hydrogenase beta subunit [Vibrio crassostreae]CAK2016217.1 Coenzyme F420-reducing hydrogenase beta subunit [Vibrio crassostreae]CAK2019153.1 Coenzyme F420-reducing hydrogenase beta subunit [Vibrio crassostreae]CAK2801935.1 Coenzyme F420-reducing hydrogenase beta subunit [Vibrio crassos
MKVKEFNSKKIYSDVSGISSYVDNRIKIEMNSYGLYEEVINDDITGDLSPLVQKVSPYLNNKMSISDVAETLFSEHECIRHDDRIGYYKSLFVGHVKEGEYRENASSGGMGTWIFKELFEKGLIDGVIHVKENADKASSILFKYGISKSIEEIQAGAKTKYYPVELSEVLDLVKNNKGKYAIVGIPSFIASIRLLALNDAEIKERIIFTVGLICGHQKSSKFADYMAWQVGIRPGNLKEIDFRHKLNDAKADSYAIKMTGLVDGEIKTVIKSKNHLSGQNWGFGYFKPLASDFTDDVFNETADIVVGDAWLPEYTNDSEGNNIVIIRSPIIQNLITEAIDEDKLVMNDVDADTIFKSQAAHYRHTYDELSYRQYKQKKNNRWYPINRVNESTTISFLRGKVQDIRMEISSKSHRNFKMAVEKNDLAFFEKKMKILTYKYKFVYYLMAIQGKGVTGTLNIILKKLKSS